MRSAHETQHRPYSDPETAARKLEIANATEAVQDVVATPMPSAARAGILISYRRPTIAGRNCT